MKKYVKSHIPQWMPIIGLFILSILFCWRIFTGNIFIPLDILMHIHPWKYSYERVPVINNINSDIVLQIYPRRLLTNAIISKGEFPLWNPSILTGTPLLADGQLALFYPPSVLFLLVPLPYAFGIYAWLNLFLAGVGTLLFAKRLAIGIFPSFISSVSYMLSGFLITWLQFPEFSAVMAILPWCFWIIDIALQKQKVHYWVCAAMILAIPLVTQIQIGFYIYIALSFYIVHALYKQPSWHIRRATIIKTLLTYSIAFSLSAIQLLPQISLSSQGQRSDMGFVTGTSTSYFVNLLSLIFPLIGGTPYSEQAWWHPHILQRPVSYTGIITLLLASIGLFRSSHRIVRFFALLAIGCFCMAISTPLAEVVAFLFPPYRQFSDQTRWFALWNFAIAMLAGLGVHSLIEGQTVKNRVNQLGFGLIAGGLAVWGLSHIALFTPQSRYAVYSSLIREVLSPQIIAIISLSILMALLSLYQRISVLIRMTCICLILVTDLFWYSSNYNPSVQPQTLFKPTSDLISGLSALNSPYDLRDNLYPPTQQITFLQQQRQPFRILGGDYESLKSNINTTFGLSDIRGYQSLYLAQYNRMTRLVDGKDYHQLGQGAASLHAYFTSAYQQRRLLNMLNVEFIVFTPNSKNPQAYQPLELVHSSDEGTIYRNPQVLPRAWFVHQIEVIPDSVAQLDRLADPTFDPKITAIVDEPIADFDPSTTVELTPTVTYAPNRVTIEAEPSSPSFLVLSDAYTPDWSVKVGDKPAKLYRTNYAFRGVLLDAGKQVIEFSYRPRSFVIGSMISAMTLLGIVLSFVFHYGYVRFRKSEHNIS